jgi:protoporphyrinogen oxidase
MAISYDIAVLGAGISGLTFAHRCASAGLRTLVLEKAAQPGGCLHTARTTATTNHAEAFWFELGAHTLYNSYGSLLDIMGTLGLEDQILRRQKAPYRLLVDGKVRSVPSQLALGELFLSSWRAFTSRKDGHTVSEYYGRLVGKRNWQRVFAPLLSAVPSQRAEDFPADMLFKSRPRRKDLPRSFTLKGGLSTLVDHLVREQPITLRLNSGARSLDRTAQGFVVHAEDGSATEVQSIALALPSDVAATLLSTVAPGAAAALGRIRTASLMSTGVVFDKPDLPLARLAGLVPIDDVFFSAVSRDVIPDQRYRALAFHFKVGLSSQERLDRIAAVTSVAPARFVHVAEHASSLPSPQLGHPDIVRAIDESIAGTRLFITGNYFGGLAIEDCVLRSTAEAQRLVSANR